MWRHKNEPLRQTVATKNTKPLQLIGLVPASVGNLYEFSVPDEGMVHLHDGACTEICYETTEARLSLVFSFDQEWAPGQRPGGCLVRMVFDQASVTAWEHEPGEAEHGGQCSGFDRHGETKFKLELFNDIVTFSAHSVTVQVLDHPTTNHIG